MTPPRFIDPSADRPPPPVPPQLAARLRRELGEPLYALVAEAELLVGRAEAAGDEEQRVAGERILRLGRQLTSALRDLR